MKRLFQPYIDFLRQPDVAGLFLVAALSRLPLTMNSLALTLYLRAALGDFAQAGLAVGVYFIAMAVVAPLLGRMIDRIGPWWPLRVTGVLQPLALIGLYLTATRGALPWVLLAACGAGLCSPPLTTLTRTLWRHRFGDDGQRRLAYALDSVMTELNFTLGPAVVGLIAALVAPTIALQVTIACNLLAFVLFHQSSALCHWRQEPPTARHWLGPLRDLRLVSYFVLSFGLTFCLGLLEVSYPAYALQVEIPVLAGLLIGLNCLGSACGGALFGAWQSKRSLEGQYTLAVSCLLVPFVLHALFQQVPLMLVVAFIGGLTVAPALTSMTLLITKRAPAHYATEAFTWSSTFIISGLGTGMASAGALIEAFSLTYAFWSGAALVVGMVLAGLFLQNRRTATAE